MLVGGQGFNPLPMPFPLFSDCIVPVCLVTSKPLKCIHYRVIWLLKRISLATSPAREIVGIGLPMTG